MRTMTEDEAGDMGFLDLLDQSFYACEEDIKNQIVVTTFKELDSLEATIGGTLDEPSFQSVARVFPDMEIAAVIQYPDEGRIEIGSSYINVRSQEEGLKIQELIDLGRGWFRCDTFVPGQWTFFERE